MGHCMFVIFMGDTHVTLSLARLITTHDVQGVVGFTTGGFAIYKIMHFANNIILLLGMDHIIVDIICIIIDTLF